MTSIEPARRARHKFLTTTVPALASSRYASVVLALVVLLVLSPILARGSLSQTALLSMLPFAAILAIAAAGQTIVIQQAGIDLSVPGMISASAMIMNTVADGKEGAQAFAGIALGLIVPMVAGAMSGLVVSWFRVTPLVATLAMNGLLLGLVLFVSGGQIAHRAPASITAFAIDRTLGVPNTVLVAIVVIAILVIITSRSVYGRRFVAVGSSLKASATAGIPTTLYTASAFALAGLCYGIAGVFIAAYLSSPSVFVGNDYLLSSIAAVVVGGTALSGGKGSIVATAFGALFLTQVDRVISGIGAPQSIQLIVEGSVLLLALALHIVLGKVRRSIAARAARGRNAEAALAFASDVELPTPIDDEFVDDNSEHSTPR